MADQVLHNIRQEWVWECFFVCDEQLFLLIWSPAAAVFFLCSIFLNALDKFCMWGEKPGVRASGQPHFEPFWASSHLLELSCAGHAALLKC